MIRGIIIGHGDFGKAMLSTAERIVGKQQFVDVISNVGLSCELLTKKIEKILKSNKKHETIIFVDLPGGSCTISCFNLLKNEKKLNIICGINLPILIEFFTIRNKHSVHDIIPILIKKGKENIFQLKSRV